MNDLGIGMLVLYVVALILSLGIGSAHSRIERLAQRVDKLEKRS